MHFEYLSVNKSSHISDYTTIATQALFDQMESFIWRVASTQIYTSTLKYQSVTTKCVPN